MQAENLFSPDYATARQRFWDAAEELGWKLESFSREGSGPNDEPLLTDAASCPVEDRAKVLVITSGIHGVEGFFGSAVQLALLRQWKQHGSPAVKCLFLHGLNPYGFAWRRRFDENNVDLNRNFLLPGEVFEGAPPTYARLDSFLNPQRPPSRWDPFLAKATWLITRYGITALRQAIASGQYDFPKGVFFGGHQPSTLQPLLEQNVPIWLAGSQKVVHLDFHTGLGPKGTHKLLIDYSLSDWQHACLTNWFGPESFEESQASGIAYEARGGYGRWCVEKNFAPKYLYACAEFGTYGPVKVLKGLRRENQAHHWGKPNDPATRSAKEHLHELFCPHDSKWRSRVIRDSCELVNQAVAGLTAEA